MDAPREKMGKERAVRRTTWGSLLVVVVWALLFSACAWAFQVSELSSASMSPALLPGDSVLVNRLIYRLRPPRRGDIIVFHFPQTGDRNFVKRVIGVPGDVVQEQAGRLTVNGLVVHVSRTDPSDPAEALNAALGPERVPADRLYVLGDNWRTSLDSRFWGTVDEREVVGKAVLICWSRGTHWWDVHWNRIGRWLE
jgi:signal peptidase I